MDYSFTATAVQGTGTAQAGIAGEALAAGDYIYLDATDGNKAKKGQCDGTEAQAAIVGICANSAPAAGQPIQYFTAGEITVDAGAFSVAGVGALLVMGGVAGQAKDVGDLTNDDFVTLIGIVTATNKFRLDLNRFAVQRPSA